MDAAAQGPRIVGGRIYALFAFDVAGAIDLERIPGVLRPGRALLSGRKPAPEYVRYAVAPVEIALGAREVSFGGRNLAVATTARLFDFGAVSIAFEIPAPERFDELPSLAEALLRADLAHGARRVLDELLARILPALDTPYENDLVEDYYVFQVDSLDPAEEAEGLLRRHGGTIASVVDMDAGPLSRQQIDESLRDPLSFSPADLVVANWSAAFVLDPDYADTLLVLEFLNVQLVELRLLDGQLDAALARFSGEVYRDPSLWSSVRGPHREAIRELSERMVEAQHLGERVENAVKLVPDVYLARVHRRSAARLGLPTWQRLVDTKLDAMRHLTSVLVERAAARRAEALEITIIVLIALEIVLALAGFVA
ncbi:hypothetical protein MYXO_00387 [Myxococcaceae bacterium]|jgi:hypothetical protein|nr:hypothetical protein MYXO_00387 [Myxococcaceae bacterium]